MRTRMISFCISVYCCSFSYQRHFDGFVQERCNSIAKARELRLSCTNPSKVWTRKYLWHKCRSTVSRKHCVHYCSVNTELLSRFVLFLTLGQKQWWPCRISVLQNFVETVHMNLDRFTVIPFCVILLMAGHYRYKGCLGARWMVSHCLIQ